MLTNSRVMLTTAESGHHHSKVVTTGARVIVTGASVIKAGARSGFNIAKEILTCRRVTLGKVKAVKEKA